MRKQPGGGICDGTFGEKCDRMTRTFLFKIAEEIVKNRILSLRSRHCSMISSLTNRMKEFDTLQIFTKKSGNVNRLTNFDKEP